MRGSKLPRLKDFHSPELSYSPEIIARNSKALDNLSVPRTIKSSPSLVGNPRLSTLADKILITGYGLLSDEIKNGMEPIQTTLFPIYRRIIPSAVPPRRSSPTTPFLLITSSSFVGQCPRRRHNATVKMIRPTGSMTSFSLERRFSRKTLFLFHL